MIIHQISLEISANTEFREILTESIKLANQYKALVTFTFYNTPMVIYPGDDLEEKFNSYINKV